MFSFKKKVNDNTIDEMLSFTFKLLKRTRPELPDEKVMALTESAIFRAGSNLIMKNEKRPEIFHFSGAKQKPSNIPVPLSPYRSKNDVPGDLQRQSLPPQRKRPYNNHYCEKIENTHNEARRRTSQGEGNKSKATEKQNVFERLYSLRKRKEVKSETPEKAKPCCRKAGTNSTDIQHGAPEIKKKRSCCKNIDDATSDHSNQSVFERLYASRKSFNAKCSSQNKSRQCCAENGPTKPIDQPPKSRIHLVSHSSCSSEPERMKKERLPSTSSNSTISVSATSDFGTQEDFSEDELMDNTVAFKESKNHVKKEVHDVSSGLENISEVLSHLDLQLISDISYCETLL